MVNSQKGMLVQLVRLPQISAPLSYPRRSPTLRLLQEKPLQFLLSLSCPISLISATLAHIGEWFLLHEINSNGFHFFGFEEFLFMHYSLIFRYDCILFECQKTCQALLDHYLCRQ